MDSEALYKLVVPAVRETLKREWDTIGVAEWPEAADEYDMYIPGVVALLQRDADDREIAAHLDRIAGERMGLAPNRARTSAAAAALRARWQKIARSDA
jgi:hypothetical protein